MTVIEYSHSYEDPDTGDVIDVMVTTDDDEPEIRNAGRVLGRRSDRAQHGRGRQVARAGSQGSGAQRMRVTRPQLGPVGPSPIGPYAGPYAPHGPYVGPYAPGHAGPVVGNIGGDYLAIRKSAIAELIPSLGAVWASFLGQPEAPKAIGDDVVDRDNAAAHRSALSKHSQNQTRILALTELASRAVKLFTGSENG